MSPASTWPARARPSGRRSRSRRLGLVDQHHARTLRPELDVRDNVALQLRLRRARPRRARPARADATLAGSGWAPGRPPGRRCPAARRSGSASAPRVAHGPRALLADEPTGELDRAAADAVYDLLAEAAAAPARRCVLVTHDAGAARIADRVVRIRDGRLCEQWRRPDAGARETLVVDDRGWVRLPEPLRRRPGVARRRARPAGPRRCGMTLGRYGAAPGRPTDAGRRARRREPARWSCPARRAGRA